MTHTPLTRRPASASRAPAPDFIIGGAPKCGTTSLHFILDQHPEIALPQDEVNFFDADDPLNWPDFFRVEGGQLHWLDTATDDGARAEWYRGLYAKLGNHKLLGEDSTQYLFSPIAPRRVKARLPDAKVIFMLRDPVRRAYSQYWHEMKMMRATCSFENALTAMPQIVAQSTYAPHLRTWFDVLGSDKVLVILMEDFQKDIQANMDRIADFIGIERFDVSDYDLWFNRSYYPVWPRGQMLMNHVGKRVARLRYRTHMKTDWTRRDDINNKIYQKWFHKVTPILFRAEKAPPMKPETESYLAAHLSERNEGLDTLLDMNLRKVWKSWQPMDRGQAA